MTDLFLIHRQSSGRAGLLGVSAVLAGWIAVGAVMWSAFVAPHAREPERCQLVCHQLSGQHPKG